MKDEIKEILYCDIYNDLDDEKYNKLLDYITNLHEKCENLDEAYKNLQEELEEEKRIEQASLDTITNLQEENKRLKEERQNIDNRNRNQKIANRKLQEEIESVRKNNRTRKSRCRKQTKKKNMYKTRNEKAIPMLEELNIKLKEILKIGIDIKEIIDIKNQLQGKSDE